MEKPGDASASLFYCARPAKMDCFAGESSFYLESHSWIKGFWGNYEVKLVPTLKRELILHGKSVR